jgi:hypothetical protein
MRFHDPVAVVDAAGIGVQKQQVLLRAMINAGQQLLLSSPASGATNSSFRIEATSP